MLEIKPQEIKYKPQWIVLSADKIKQEKEYQRWRTTLGNYCRQIITKKKLIHMNTTYRNSGT
jgi:hypothetical protein